MLVAGFKDPDLPPNQPPEWTSQPSPSFTKDVAGTTYDFKQNVTDPEGDTLTFTLNAGSSSLPAGLSLSSAGVLSGTPTASGDTTGVIIDADDGTNSPVASSAFSITVGVTSATVWPVQDPVSYVPAVRNRNGTGEGTSAGRGWGMDGRHAYHQWNVSAQTGTSPTVLHVDTLSGADTNTDTTHGSFLWAINEPGPRIIVFDVGGVIQLSTDCHIDSGMCWIAGQTAPTQVIIENTQVDSSLRIRAGNVFIQHMFFWHSALPVNPGFDADNNDNVFITSGNRSRHTGANNASVLTQANHEWATNEWSGYAVDNITDGSVATVTSNTDTTLTATLSSGTDNDWDNNDLAQISFENVVFDHCAFGGGTDQVLLHNDSHEKVTYIDCIVAWPRGKNPEEDPATNGEYDGVNGHQYGWSIGGNSASENVDYVSLIGNLVASCEERCPNMVLGHVTLANHFMYNWDTAVASAIRGKSNEDLVINYNCVGLRAKQGPSVGGDPLEIGRDDGDQSPDTGSLFHISDTRAAEYVSDEWDVVDANLYSSMRQNTIVTSAWPEGLVAADTGRDSGTITEAQYESLLTDNVGPRPNARHGHITTLISGVKDGTGTMATDYTAPTEALQTSAYTEPGSPHTEGTETGRTVIEEDLLDKAEALLN